MLKTSCQLEFEGELQNKKVMHPVKYKALTNRRSRGKKGTGRLRKDGRSRIGMFYRIFLKYFL